MNPPDRTSATEFAGRLVLLAMPFALLAVLWETWLAVDLEQRQQVFLARTADRLERLAVRADANLYARRRLDRIHANVARQPSLLAPGTATVALPRLSIGIDVHLHWADRDGVWRGSHPERASHGWMMKQLLRALADPAVDPRSPARRRLDRALQQAFGHARTVDFIAQRRGQIFPVLAIHRGPGWLAWYRGRFGILVAWCHRIPDEARRMAWADRVEGPAEPEPAGFGYGILHRQEWTPVAGAITQAAAAVWTEFATAGRESGASLDHWWVFRLAESGVIYYICYPSATRPGRRASWPVLAALALAAAWTIARFGGSAGDWGPIRRLSVVMFIAAALVPIAGMGMGTIWLLSSRETVLRNQVLRYASDTIAAIDARFPRFLRRCEHELARITRNPAFAADPATADRLAATVTRRLQARLELRAPDARVLACNDPDAGGMKQFMPTFLRLVLQRWAPRRFVPAANESDRIADQLFGEDDTGFPPMANMPRTLLPIRTGGAPSYLFWDCFPESTAPAAMATLFIPRERLVTRYLGEQVRGRWQVLGTSCRLAGFHLGTGTWVSGRLTHHGRLTPLAWRASLLRRALTGSLEIDARRHWYTVVPPAELRPYCLLALFPDEAISETMQRLRFRIFVGLLAAVAVAGFLGRSIARRLLDPVAALAAGVQALRQRRFDCQLTIDRPDELGRLATAFNEMVAEMRELDLARAVQTGLLPRSYPEVPGYTLDAACIFAGNLGGDCLDVRFLPDGRLSFLVGDVSGHGVGSALLMAYIKAVLTLWSEQPDDRPDGLAVRLDRLLAAIGHQRRFLAVIHGLLDPTSHRLTLVHGGHPYPLLSRADGTSRYLGEPAWPLGSRRRTPTLPVGAIDLEPGDQLVCYTDGLVEALDSQGRMLGYDGLATLVERRTPTASAHDLLQTLGQHHRQRCPQPADDVTLLAIGRNLAS